jgi:hypothetical protein
MLFCKGVNSVFDPEAAGFIAAGGLSGAVCASLVTAARPTTPNASVAATTVKFFTKRPLPLKE